MKRGLDLILFLLVLGSYVGVFTVTKYTSLIVFITGLSGGCIAPIISD